LPIIRWTEATSSSSDQCGTKGMRKTNQAGFTLAETAVVLAVACILMAVAIPSFDVMYQSSNADASAQLVAQQLNYARALAVGSHGPVVFQIDPSMNTIAVAAGTGSERGPLALPGKMRFQSSAPALDTPDGLGSAVLGMGDYTALTFLDNGAAVEDAASNNLCSGTFFLQRQGGDASSRRAVTLLGGTGRVRIWRYDTKDNGWK
jgi:prepilin-type N-terminal cleavage/methylation domain-containing protein